MAWTKMIVGIGSLVLVACGSEFKSNDESGGGGNAGNTASGGSGASAGSGGSSGASGSGGDPASGGSTGTGGAPGSGGAVASGGNVASGGSSSGGVPNTGGISSSGGTSSTGGMAGSGGSTMECTPGAVQCDHDPALRCTEAGKWDESSCGPLLLGDITGIDASKLPGFDVGFRCKSLVVCALSQTSCVYFATDTILGSLQSSEETYTDGTSLVMPEAVKISIGTGAASQCGDVPLAISAGESIDLHLPNDAVVRVFFPAITVLSITLYVREDGATFYDSALTQLAQGPN